MEVRCSMKFNKEQREFLKKKLIKHGFLVASIFNDPEEIDEYNKIMVYNDGEPISSYAVLHSIKDDEELSKFRAENIDVKAEILMERGELLARGVRPLNANIPEKTQLEAIKFMLRILKPDLFKDMDKITINNNTPGVVINTGGDAGETVMDYLKHQHGTDSSE